MNAVPAKQKGQSKAPGGKIPLKESVAKKVVPPPTVQPAASNTSLHSKKTQSKVSHFRHSKSTITKGKGSEHNCRASEAKTVTTCKSTATKEEPKTTTGAKPKLPAFPEELGPVLVDQKLYNRLVKRYDLNGAPPSNHGGMSNILNEGTTGSGAASHISHFKTQSFAGSGSLSKLSAKVDSHSTVDGAKRNGKEKKAVKQ